jgi:hypothetical protein
MAQYPAGSFLNNKEDEDDVYTFDWGDDSGPVSEPTAKSKSVNEDVYTFDWGDDSTPAPEPEQGFVDDVIDFFGDTAIDLASGVVQFGQSTVGIGSLLTGGKLSEGMRALGYRPEEATSFLKDMYSTARKREEAEFEAAKGWDAALDLITSPRLLVGKVVETAPQMVGMIGVAKAFAARSFAGAYKAAISGGAIKKDALKIALDASIKTATKASAMAEGAMQGGSSFDQYMDEGMELGKAYVAAGGSAITTAAGAFFGGKLGNWAGLGDISAGVTSGGGVITRFAKGAVQEGLLEESGQSATEQMWDNYAHDRPVLYGV